MSEKPYYEQNYQPSHSEVPNPSVGRIVKSLFLNPFTWNARSTRKAFWVGYVAQLIITVILGILSLLALIPSIIINSDNQGNFNFSFTTASVLVIIFEIIILAVVIWVKLGLLGYAVRRLHDTDHSGWWLWLDVIPFGWIFILYLLILPSLEEPVKWGSYLLLDGE